jgi:hypothetical protein
VNEFVKKLREARVKQIGAVLIALDPGETTGWAAFHSCVLLAAGFTKNPYEVIDLLPQETRDPDRVVIELPQYYPRKTKSVADLITLAVLVGELRGLWLRRCSSRQDVELVWPTTWKGSTPKDIHNERVLGKLYDGEVEKLQKSPRSKKWNHNMLDAVGLGLWKLTRMS